MHSFFPLISWRSPLTVWEENPSFLLAEIVLFLGVICGLYIVTQSNDRWSKVLLFSSLTGGAAIELLTIMEPQIGNFYHSQASLMLFGLREPVYMLLYYIFFQWAAVSTAWQLHLPPMGEAAFACLLGSLLHQLLDQVGLAFLWWTWHNDEPLYRDRAFGVPIASTFWVSSTLLALSLCVRIARSFSPYLQSWVGIVFYSILLGPLAAVGVMNGPFMVLYHPLVTFMELHASIALYALRVLCFVAIGWSLWREQAAIVQHTRNRFAVPLLCIGFVGFLCCIIFFFDAKYIVRSSFGQNYGSCDSVESSFWGAFKRRAAVCTQTVPERDHYDFHCVEPGFALTAGPPNISSPSAWYTVCGVSVTKSDQIQALALFVGVSLLALLAIFVAAEPKTKDLIKKKRN